MKINNENLLSNIDFRPFGISFLNDKLFVINEGYKNGGESVLIFNIEKDFTLTLMSHIPFENSFLGRLDDLVAISE